MNLVYLHYYKLSDNIWPLVDLLFVFWEQNQWIQPQPIAEDKPMHMFGGFPP